MVTTSHATGLEKTLSPFLSKLVQLLPDLYRSTNSTYNNVMLLVIRRFGCALGRTNPDKTARLIIKIDLI